jgi:hypothetical protein
MGFFDLFKKKEPHASTLDFETLFQKAAGEPAYRAEFYRRLFSEEVFVLKVEEPGDENVESGQTYTTKESTGLILKSFEDGRIPVFTSIARIFDNNIIKERVTYIGLKGEALFATNRGCTFLVNPFSTHSKEILPGEIDTIISGKIFTGNAKTLLIKQETKVQLGQPAIYPTEIVNSLKELFSTNPAVRAAYLGWIYDASSGEPPHYIFGIDAKGDIQKLLESAGFIARHFLKPDEFVDFFRIDGDTGVSGYLKSTTPFFKR